tara:strand:- start:22 stop:450 length:429 start_codon:yes stop_codon:yes gene_type:complete
MVVLEAVALVPLELILLLMGLLVMVALDIHGLMEHLMLVVAVAERKLPEQFLVVELEVAGMVQLIVIPLLELVIQAAVPVVLEGRVKQQLLVVQVLLFLDILEQLNWVLAERFLLLAVIPITHLQALELIQHKGKIWHTLQK